MAFKDQIENAFFGCIFEARACLRFSKRIVGWAVDDSMIEELVIKAFERAIAGGAVKAGTILYTDQGAQYVSTNFRALLAAHGCRALPCRAEVTAMTTRQPRVSSRACVVELLEDGIFECVEQARSETFAFIEGYYNRVRRHPVLGYKSPAEFERDFNHQK